MGIKPILFDTDMVRAILEGRKAVTRRVVKFKYPHEAGSVKIGKSVQSRTAPELIYFNLSGRPTTVYTAPYQPGDILWVRETWADYQRPGGKSVYLYKTHDKNRKIVEEVSNEVIKRRPSIHMPREAARIFLRVTDVGVERLQDITPKDAGNEGVEWETDNSGQFRRGQFMRLWDSTIKPADRDKYGWDANPWVWVITFEQISKEEALK